MRPLFLSTAAGALLFASTACSDSVQVTEKTEAVGPAGKVKTAEAAEQATDEEPKNTAYGMYPESDILDEHVHADDYQMRVVEDNQSIRVIILKDADGHSQYKSVFVKNNGMVKVMSFDQGLVFQGVIGS
ncbi:hypothetical protein [Lentibacillus salicampi]|uniref:DUF3221 domain-containing protein n=1 Tax=Lentibacillus salicampi TaxID=175306 RepID=A0A4Y9ABI2_9BACI|nr:hypothetical protein [Lentibacillus salicampi]TFJ93269.1 hypothetical protein E4U82_08020 [Lentibacillus salicampi]